MRVLTYALLAQLSFVDAQVAEIEKASNDSLLWGPYRPNLYFGVRPRIPKSLMGGLLWTKVEDHTVQHSKSRFFPQLTVPDKMHYGWVPSVVGGVLICQCSLPTHLRAARA